MFITGTRADFRVYFRHITPSGKNYTGQNKNKTI